MTGHPAFVAHALQAHQDGSVAHRLLLRVAVAKEERFTGPAKFAQDFEYLERLPCQRHDMRRSHLHTVSRYVPSRGVDVEFQPTASRSFNQPISNVPGDA